MWQTTPRMIDHTQNLTDHIQNVTNHPEYARSHPEWVRPHPKCTRPHPECARPNPECDQSPRICQITQNGSDHTQNVPDHIQNVPDHTKNVTYRRCQVHLPPTTQHTNNKFTTMDSKESWHCHWPPSHSGSPRLPGLPVWLAVRTQVCCVAHAAPCAPCGPSSPPPCQGHPACQSTRLGGWHTHLTVIRKTVHKVYFDQLFPVFHCLKCAYTRKQISNWLSVLAVVFVWPFLKTALTSYVRIVLKICNKCSTERAHACACTRVCVCVCVCVCMCVCECVCVCIRAFSKLEGSRVFASTDGPVSDQLQWTSDQFTWTTFVTLFAATLVSKMSSVIIKYSSTQRQHDPVAGFQLYLRQSHPQLSCCRVGSDRSN